MNTAKGKKNRRHCGLCCPLEHHLSDCIWLVKSIFNVFFFSWNTVKRNIFMHVLKVNIKRCWSYSSLNMSHMRSSIMIFIELRQVYYKYLTSFSSNSVCSYLNCMKFRPNYIRSHSTLLQPTALWMAQMCMIEETHYLCFFPRFRTAIWWHTT